MSSISEKVKYIFNQGQTRKHHCHWPGCTKNVPPSMWGCKVHWYTLPSLLRAKIWSAFVPGQEVKGTPSAAYIKVAKEVQDWIEQNATKLK